MATQPCKDCDKSMSRLAHRCPHCKRETFYGWLNKMMGADFIWLIVLLMLYND